MYSEFPSCHSATAFYQRFARAIWVPYLCIINSTDINVPPTRWMKSSRHSPEVKTDAAAAGLYFCATVVKSMHSRVNILARISNCTKT